ncbi:MAG: TIGR03088 family PEP-CTERM/XrtA system glycosyltransferase [Sutterellaceae bacterium]|nr:TIGR03088 family PEP-CTERM/XrtA system glycosyltransferase [Burkholderiaceae bacterium]MDW8429330.1 TIGR03088 family PEP-CTERM/XrtA system glycosyltransferase [Sutterellaceae bacterium]
MSDVRPLIVHVVYRFAVGGLENGVVNLINHLPHERWRHTVVALTDVCERFRQRVQRDDVAYVSLHKPAGHGVRLYPRLFRLFRELRPAIVHTRNLAALEATVPAWAAGVPVRMHGEHGRDIDDLDGTSRKHRLLRRLYRPFVQQYVALSRDLERYLIEAIGVPPQRVRHIYNGVDARRFAPTHGPRLEVKDSPFNGPGLFVLGAVGRFEPVKDPLNLVQALAHAFALRPDATERLRLVLVGDGPLRAPVAEAVRSGGLDRFVWFAGQRADVPDLLRGLDCFVLPSLAEGISNTLLEAMATGLPVIATRVGANADLMENGRCGQLVPRADPLSLAQAILRYLDNPQLAAQHGRAARQIVEQRFTLERMVQDYEDLYLRLLAQCGRAPGATDAVIRHERISGLN